MRQQNHRDHAISSENFARIRKIIHDRSGMAMRVRLRRLQLLIAAVVLAAAALLAVCHSRLWEVTAQSRAPLPPVAAPSGGILGHRTAMEAGALGARETTPMDEMD